MLRILRTTLTLLAAIESIGISQGFALKSQIQEISGPIVAVNPLTLTIQGASGKKKVIAKDAITRTSGGELKAGERVTIYYTASASEGDWHSRFNDSLGDPDVDVPAKIKIGPSSP